MAATRVYYASDVHGSNRCFRKFLNAAKFYQANVLVMGGDILGKAIVFLEEVSPGMYATEEHGHQVRLTTEAEVQAFEQRASDRGLYPYRCRVGEPQELRDAGEIEPLFTRLMRERLEAWIALADERLAGTGVRCFIMGGNDDPPGVLASLDKSGDVTCWILPAPQAGSPHSTDKSALYSSEGHAVCNPEDHVVLLDDASEMISCGWSNPTPWQTPRECSEEELGKRIEALMVQVKRPESLVMNLHVPPFQSGLDDAPELDASLKVQTSLGQTRFKPVGSTAVRAMIERYQPLLGLHGHVHEAHASCKIGRTVCINPGSDFSEGILHGVLVTLNKGKLKGYQMVSG